MSRRASSARRRERLLDQDVLAGLAARAGRARSGCSTGVAITTASTPGSSRTLGGVDGDPDVRVPRADEREPLRPQVADAAQLRAPASPRSCGRGSVPSSRSRRRRSRSRPRLLHTRSRPRTRARTGQGARRMRHVITRPMRPQGSARWLAASGPCRAPGADRRHPRRRGGRSATCRRSWPRCSGSTSSCPIRRSAETSGCPPRRRGIP